MLTILHFADAHIDMANSGRHDSVSGLPQRVQDFLNGLPYNDEPRPPGETLRSFRGVLRTGTSGFAYPGWAPAFYPPGARGVSAPGEPSAVDTIGTRSVEASSITLRIVSSLRSTACASA